MEPPSLLGVAQLLMDHVGEQPGDELQVLAT
ncbi:hypothetical protein PPSIR1_01472 [Plesiocystis pacifica SIR-1]|uniref:Uncharacterized protein n=1 Tax=Plesiocystis pacifica SIR-1 TaxID=391625 RepID=A6G8E5_9BACT|nr:hypothetical protein PPSIR1_01472 [Plesiocystis pacifica SIR-1]